MPWRFVFPCPERSGDGEGSAGRCAAAPAGPQGAGGRAVGSPAREQVDARPAIGSREGCVFLSTRDVNLSIVKIWEIRIENYWRVFFIFI